MICDSDFIFAPTARKLRYTIEEKRRLYAQLIMITDDFTFEKSRLHIALDTFLSF